MNAQPEDTALNRRHRVVVIGSGFGGLNAVKKLKRADVDIKLIARTTHHLFQPMLYQVATGIVAEGAIAPPTRMILRGQHNAQVLLGDVTHIDLSRQVRRLGVARPQLRNPFRQPDHRCRGRPVLLRQRPVRRIRARHEVHRRRAGIARSHHERIRGGRAVQRSGATQEAAHVHRRRRGTDRRRDGRPDRRTRGLHAQRRLTAISIRRRHGSSCWTPPPRYCRRWARISARRPPRGWKRWASKSNSARWSPTSTATASQSRTPTAPPVASSRPAKCGRPVSPPAPWAAIWPASRASNSTAQAGSRCCPTCRFPVTPTCSSSGTWPLSTACPGLRRAPSRAASTPRSTIKAELAGADPGPARAVPVLRQRLDGRGVAVLRGGENRSARVRRHHRLVRLAAAALGLPDRVQEQGHHGAVVDR